MDIELTEEQGLLADTVAMLLERQSPVSKVRSLADDPVGFDRNLWASYGAMGLFGLLVSEVRGGSNIGEDGVVDAAMVCEQMGRTLQPGPFIPTLLVAQSIAESEQSEGRKVVLDDLLAGRQVASWAFAEGGSWDPADVALEAQREPFGYVLHGTKDMVQDAHVADQILVTARLDGSLADFLVPTGVAGLSSDPYVSLDGTRRFGQLHLDAVHIPDSARVGQQGSGEASMARRFDRSVALQCAETVGATAAIFEITVEYAKDRLSFGRPIGSYQAIKHRLADMMVLLEAAKATAASVAREMTGDASITLLASTDKSYVAEACTSVVQEALQIHGGIGFTWEHDLHLYLRRIKSNEALLGTPAWHRERVYTLIAAQPKVINRGLPAAASTKHDPTERVDHGETTTVRNSASEEWPDEQAFRVAAREWLAANMSLRNQDVQPSRDPTNEAGEVSRAKELQSQLSGGGFAALTFPKEYGGQGLGIRYQQIFDEESAAYEMPTILRVPTLAIIGPTLEACGTPLQKERYLPPLIRGDEWWVQLLSEPTGGSDLAGVITRATRDGDLFIVHGQKVWSTGAHYSHFGLCLVRTDPDAPKHRGLTMLIVPFDATGVTVRPIKQITGEADFCEVFFDDVPVPVDNVVGAVNEGWSVATTLMTFERRAAGVGRPRDVVGDLLWLARQRGLTDHPEVQQAIARAYVTGSVEGYFARRVAAAIQSGLMPPPASALLKLYRADKHQRNAETAMQIAGERGVLWSQSDERGDEWALEYLGSRARSIAGGTNEMQRNVVGDRLIGLPREPQPSSDLPFNQIQQNRFRPRTT
jgi:alkylation response protein AidB-like acyl-CoA dehydrogenase